MRLIDADALIESIKHGLWNWETVDGITATTVLKQTIRDIQNMPTEVVTCKECKYNKGEVNEKGFQICSANGMDITDDDYCSWGE